MRQQIAPRSKQFRFASVGLFNLALVAVAYASTRPEWREGLGWVTPAIVGFSYGLFLWFIRLLAVRTLSMPLYLWALLVGGSAMAGGIMWRTWPHGMVAAATTALCFCALYLRYDVRIPRPTT